MPLLPHEEHPVDHFHVSKHSDPGDGSSDTDANMTSSTKENNLQKKDGEGSNNIHTGTLGTSDIRCMACSRILILCMLFSMAGVAGGLTYYFTSTQEQEDFEVEVRIRQRHNVRLDFVPCF